MVGALASSSCWAEAVNRGRYLGVWPLATEEDLAFLHRQGRMVMSPARRRIWGPVFAESSLRSLGTVGGLWSWSCTRSSRSPGIDKGSLLNLSLGGVGQPSLELWCRLFFLFRGAYSCSWDSLLHCLIGEACSWLIPPGCGYITIGDMIPHIEWKNMFLPEHSYG